ANAHAMPGVGHAETVAAEDVDPILLAHRADLARIVDRKLLRDDEYFAQLRVDPDQLRHAIARAGGRQIHDAAVEAMAVDQSFPNVVVDGNVSDRGFQHLPAPPG